MAKVGRNEPCPCGSAKKSNRCCFSPEQVAANARLQRTLEGLCRDVAVDLADVGRSEFYDLLNKATCLPELDLSLQIRLPTLFTPSIERAQAALDDDDDEAFDDELWEIGEMLDTNERRIELAQAVIALRDAGKVAPKLAAAAVFELSDGAGSAFLLSSIAQSIAVWAGDARTPTGLVVAAT
jgi:hypothetical protein